MVDDLLQNFLGEGYQACINDLLRFVFGVCDVVVELDYLLQQHQDVLRLHILLTSQSHLGLAHRWSLLVDVQTGVKV